MATLAGGKLYPDFVAELLDGRTLVIEHKGEYLLDIPDTLAKMVIGAAYERSDTSALFLLAVKDANGLSMREQLVSKLAYIHASCGILCDINFYKRILYHINRNFL